MFTIHKWRIISWIIINILLKFFINEIAILEFIKLNKFVDITTLSINKCQAFNYVSVKQIDISSEIIISGLNNNILKKKVKDLFGTVIHPRAYMHRKQIQYIINKLKLSGYFTYVDFNIYYLSTNQIIIIDLIPNPILNRVYVLNYQDKLIPSSYILFLFRSQLGYPKSFAQIHNSINQMMNWYHLRGYYRVNIRLEDNNTRNNIITLSIHEAKVSRIEMITYTKHISQKNNKDKAILFNLIIETLNIKLNQALNIKHLDHGVSKLKLQKIIVQCNYQIISNNDTAHNVILQLRIEVCNNKFTYIFANKIIISSNLLESLVTYTFDYLLLNNSLASYLFNCTQGLSINNISPNLYHGNSLIYTEMASFDNRPYKLLYQKPISSSQEIHEWYLAPLLFITGNNFGFRHYIGNINFSNKRYILDLQFPETGLYFDFRYEHSLMSILGFTLNLLTCSLFQHTYIYNHSNIPIPLDQISKQFLSSQNSIFYQTGIQIKVKHEMNKYFFCSKEFFLKKIAKKYSILHNNISWQNIYVLTDSYLINNLYSSFKQLWLSNIQKFLCFQVRFVYDNISSINYPWKNIQLIFKSIHFIPVMIKKNNKYLNRYLNYSHNLNLKMIHKKNIHVFFVGIKRQIFIYKLEFVTSLGSKHHFPFSEIFFLLGPDRMRGYTEQVFYLPDLKFVIINLEYHLFFVKNNSLFTFIDYVYDISYTRNDNSMGILYNLDQFNYRLAYGLGLQIQTPIKQIPPLRLEYGFNIKNNYCFHLRINKYYI
jgi:Omp85 superfamily domain